MAHTYVSLDAAAEILGLSVDEVKSLRESGELRGFADRGTWKFRRDHIDEYIRTTTAGSDPDIPIFDESGPGASDLFAIHPGGTAESDGDSDETGRNAIPGMDLADDGDFNFGEDVDFAEPANTEPPKPKSKPQAAPADTTGDAMIEEEFGVEDASPAETGKLARPETGTSEKPEPSPAETGKLARPEDEEASADSTGRLPQPVLDGDAPDEDDGEIEGLGVEGIEIDGREAPTPAESDILGGADDSGVNLVPDEVDSVSAELHEHDSGIILADLDSGIGVATSDILDDRESGLDLLGAGSDVLDEGDDAAEPPALGVEDSRVLIGSEALTGTDFSGDSHVARVDSDVDLTAAKETVDETGDSGIALEVGDVDETGDSGIALEVGGDDESGIALDLGGDDESGIALDLGGDDESGIALDIGGDESGIALDFSDAEESGIALDIGGDESGIALDLDGGSVLDAGDSGIALDTGDSGIALDAGDSGIALDFADSGVDATADGTQRMELVTSPEDSADDFADFDDEDSGADATQRVGVAAAAGAVVDDVDEFGETISEERIDTLDDFDDGGSFDEIDEVDDGFEDELDEIDEFEDEDEFAEVGASADPFEDDDDFDEPPVAAKPRGPQWGVVPLVGLALCTLVMTASVMITWQSMRVMWTGATESQTAFDQAVDEITKLVP